MTCDGPNMKYRSYRAAKARADRFGLTISEMLEKDREHFRNSKIGWDDFELDEQGIIIFRNKG